jgi:hypothetical protein
MRQYTFHSRLWYIRGCDELCMAEVTWVWECQGHWMQAWVRKWRRIQYMEWEPESERMQNTHKATRPVQHWAWGGFHIRHVILKSGSLAVMKCHTKCCGKPNNIPVGDGWRRQQQSRVWNIEFNDYIYDSSTKACIEMKCTYSTKESKLDWLHGGMKWWSTASC